MRRAFYWLKPLFFIDITYIFGLLAILSSKHTFFKEVRIGAGIKTLFYK